MKLLINIHGKTVAEHDTDPLEDAESLPGRSWPDTNYCTTLLCPAKWDCGGWQVPFFACELCCCSTRHLVDTQVKDACTPCRPKGFLSSKAKSLKIYFVSVLWLGQMGWAGQQAHILCLGRGNSVIMMFGSFSLTTSPSTPPYLVPQNSIPVATPTTAERSLSVGGDIS